MTTYEQPHNAQYHGPQCSHCGSRRTARIGDTALRQCAVCGETGTIHVVPSGAYVEPLKLRSGND